MVDSQKKINWNGTANIDHNKSLLHQVGNSRYHHLNSYCSMIPNYSCTLNIHLQ